MESSKAYRVILQSPSFTVNERSQVASFATSQDNWSRMIRFFWKRETEVPISNRVIEARTRSTNEVVKYEDKIEFSFYEEDTIILPGEDVSLNLIKNVAKCPEDVIYDIDLGTYTNIFLPSPKKYRFIKHDNHIEIKSIKAEESSKYWRQVYDQLALEYDSQAAELRYAKWLDLKEAQMNYWYREYPYVFGFTIYDIPPVTNGQNLLDVITNAMSILNVPFITLIAMKRLTHEEQQFFKKVYVGVLTRAAQGENEKHMEKKLEKAARASKYSNIIMNALQKQENFMEYEIHFLVFAGRNNKEATAENLETLYKQLTAAHDFLIRGENSDNIAKIFMSLYPRGEKTLMGGKVVTDGIFAGLGPFIGTGVEMGRYPFGISFKLHPDAKNFAERSEAGAAFFDPMEAYFTGAATNAHIIVSGASGSGKSMTVKGLIRRLSLKYHNNLHVVIADASGEYTIANLPFIHFMNGVVYSGEVQEETIEKEVPIYPLKINPLAIPKLLWETSEGDVEERQALVSTMKERLDRFLKLIAEESDLDAVAAVMEAANDLYYLGHPEIVGYNTDKFGNRIPVVVFDHLEEVMDRLITLYPAIKKKLKPAKTEQDKVENLKIILSDLYKAIDEKLIPPVIPDPSLEDLLLLLKARGYSQTRIYYVLYKLVHGTASVILDQKATHIDIFNNHVVGLYVPQAAGAVPTRLENAIYYAAIIDTIIAEWIHEYDTRPGFKSHYLMIVLDEFWQYLKKDVYGKVKLQDLLDYWIRYTRKYNVAFVLLSQNFKTDFIESVPALYQNAGIKLLGRQEKSDDSVMAEITGGMYGLPAPVLNMISQLTPGHFFINTENGTALLYVALSDLEMVLYDTSGKYSEVIISEE